MARVDLTCFRDASRSGAFYLSDTEAASLLALIYSHPLPPERSCTVGEKEYYRNHIRVF